jgi:hypothetical protein
MTKSLDQSRTTLANVVHPPDRSRWGGIPARVTCFEPKFHYTGVRLLPPRVRVRAQIAVAEPARDRSGARREFTAATENIN